MCPTNKRCISCYGIAPRGAATLKIRMTSAIAGVDPARRIGRTFSGRLYELTLPPCENPTVRSAFPSYLQMQMQMQMLVAYEDVSPCYVR